MYKVNSLKRLKKAELLEIVSSISLKLNGKTTKNGLIEELIEVGLCKKPLVAGGESSEKQREATTTIGLPIALDNPGIHYQSLTDQHLTSLPTITFQKIYSYLSGGEEGSMKVLDRAVKHASAGDVANIKLCQVHEFRTPGEVHHTV